MIRTKGQKVVDVLEKEETLEKEEETKVEDENYEVIYKSKLLGKDFVNLDELKKAEAEYKAELAKKEEAKLARKEEATAVQDAFTKKNQVIKAYNEAIIEARKERAEAIEKINAEYNQKVQPLVEELEKAQTEYNEALAKFQAAHPEGYHLTLKDGDNQVVLYKTKDAYRDLWQEMADEWSKTFSFWNRLLK